MKTYFRHTESFRMKPDGSHVTSLFLGNRSQHQPVCAKTISSWVREVLCVAKAHMSPGYLWGAATSAALAAVVSLVSILRASDWGRVSTPARHFSPPTLLLQIGTRTLYSMLCWASVSRSSPGKHQTLIYTQSCICWAVALPNTKQRVPQLSAPY